MIDNNESPQIISDLTNNMPMKYPPLKWTREDS